MINACEAGVTWEVPTRQIIPVIPVASLQVGESMAQIFQDSESSGGFVDGKSSRFDAFFNRFDECPWGRGVLNKINVE
jgi:hypothetical protein